MLRRLAHRGGVGSKARQKLANAFLLVPWILDGTTRGRWVGFCLHLCKWARATRRMVCGILPWKVRAGVGTNERATAAAAAATAARTTKTEDGGRLNSEGPVPSWSGHRLAGFLLRTGFLIQDTGLGRRGEQTGAGGARRRELRRARRGRRGRLGSYDGLTGGFHGRWITPGSHHGCPCCGSVARPVEAATSRRGEARQQARRSATGQAPYVLDTLSSL